MLLPQPQGGSGLVCSTFSASLRTDEGCRFKGVPQDQHGRGETLGLLSLIRLAAPSAQAAYGDLNFTFRVPWR